MMKWTSVKDGLPAEPGLYLIHSPSLDPDHPYIAMGWYEPPGESTYLGGTQDLY